MVLFIIHMTEECTVEFDARKELIQTDQFLLNFSTYGNNLFLKSIFENANSVDYQYLLPFV